MEKANTNVNNSANAATTFCTPAFGLFGTMIDLGVDLAPVRERIQECKLRYHRELWKIICERGMEGNQSGENWKKREGEGGGEGEAPPPTEEGGGGGGEGEQNQSNLTWGQNQHHNHPYSNYHHHHPGHRLHNNSSRSQGPDVRSMRTPGLPVGYRGPAIPDDRSAMAAVAAAAAAAAAGTSAATGGAMASIADSAAAATLMFQHAQQQQNLANRYNGAQLATTSRRAAQLSFSRAKAQLPSLTPTPSSAATSSNNTSHPRSSGPVHVSRDHGGCAGGFAGDAAFVPMHCGDWSGVRGTHTKKSVSRRQKHHAAAAASTTREHQAQTQAANQQLQQLLAGSQSKE